MKRKFFDVSSDDDPELKKELRANYTEVSFDILHQLEEKISTWDRMKSHTLGVKVQADSPKKNKDECN